MENFPYNPELGCKSRNTSLTKRNLYLNVTFAALFSVMMVSSTLHGEYSSTFLVFWISFGILITFTAYKVSKTFLNQAIHEKPKQKPDQSKVIKLGKTIFASHAMALGLSVLLGLVLLLPVGFKPIDSYIENKFYVHMLISTILCSPVVFKYLK